MKQIGGHWFYERAEILKAAEDFDPDNPPTTEWYTMLRFHKVQCPDGEGLFFGILNPSKWEVIVADDSEKGATIHFYEPDLIRFDDRSYDPPEPDDIRLPWVKKEKQCRKRTLQTKSTLSTKKRSEALF